MLETDLPLPLSILLVILVLTAAAWDIRTRSIPNWLSITALVAGLILNTQFGQMAGLTSAGMGLGLALLIAIPLYALRGLGGGDVKLLAAVGAIAGPMNFLMIFVLNALIGGVAAIALLMWRGGLGRTLRNVGYILGELARLRAPYRSREDLDIGHPKAVTLPQAPIIALASLLFLAASVVK